MIPLSVAEAGRALGVGPLAAPVTGVAIDSRSIRPGDLFVALRGERFDGHDFVAAAFAAGASGAVVDKSVWAERGVGPEQLIYEVEDTLKALGALAREVRRRSGAIVFAITGSVGKTSTKDVLAAMVGRVRRTVATTANQNNEIGVPLTLLAIEPDTEAVIVEMGMRGRGQIAALAAVAEPDIGVVTNIHPVHLELLGTLKDVAEAKAELITGLRAEGAVVAPGECEVLQPHLLAADCRVVQFGVGTKACLADVDAWLERLEDSPACVIVLRWPEGEARVETSYLPAYSVENVAAAAAACYAAGLPVDECARGIADVRFTGGRGEVMGPPGICLIDDTYNANPAAVRAALENLVRVADERGGRPVVVLGDMLELGPDAERYHEEIGRYAAELGVRSLWGVGPLSRATVEGFRLQVAASSGPDSDRAAGHVGSSEETCSLVAGLRPGDVVLFKASRGMKLESMVSRVVALAEAGAWTSTAGPPLSGADEPEETRPC
jgi:UDP-N-acetylmuramoyl-tripeptide--D-alanyl-D-alanine ligase